MIARASRPATTALATAVLAVAAGLGTAAAPPSAAADSADQALWFWRWSDGGEQRVRAIAVGGPTSGLPSLIATVVPARSGQRVVLQYLDRGRWRTEDVAATNARGVARLEVNPFCPDGDWCRTEFRYRLLAGGRVAPLTVRFTG